MNTQIIKKNTKERVSLKEWMDYKSGITPTKTERRAARAKKQKRKKKIDNSKNVHKKNSDKGTGNRRFW